MAFPMPAERQPAQLVPGSCPEDLARQEGFRRHPDPMPAPPHLAILNLGDELDKCAAAVDDNDDADDDVLAPTASMERSWLQTG